MTIKKRKEELYFYKKYVPNSDDRQVLEMLRKLDDHPRAKPIRNIHGKRYISWFSIHSILYEMLEVQNCSIEVREKFAEFWAIIDFFIDAQLVLSVEEIELLQENSADFNNCSEFYSDMVIYRDDEKIKK